MHPPIRLAVILSLSLSVTACAPLLGMLGTDATLVQVVANVERVKLAADGASLASSQKTLNDHIISAALGKDCKMFNILTKESVCTDTGTYVAIDSSHSPKADTQTHVAALQSNINTATAEPLPVERSTAEAALVTVNVDMKTDASMSNRASALATNIRAATAREPQAVAQPQPETTAANETPATPQQSFVTVAGTNLVRKTDPSNERQSKPENSTPAPQAQSKEPAAPAVPPRDGPAAAHPQNVADPNPRTINVSREAASG